jgi:hypothetical protein
MRFSLSIVPDLLSGLCLDRFVIVVGPSLCKQMVCQIAGRDGPGRLPVAEPAAARAA